MAYGRGQTRTCAVCGRVGTASFEPVEHDTYRRTVRVHAGDWTCRNAGQCIQRLFRGPRRQPNTEKGDGK